MRRRWFHGLTVSAGIRTCNVLAPTCLRVLLSSGSGRQNGVTCQDHRTRLARWKPYSTRASGPGHSPCDSSAPNVQRLHPSAGCQRMRSGPCKGEVFSWQSERSCGACPFVSYQHGHPMRRGWRGVMPNFLSSEPSRAAHTGKWSPFPSKCVRWWCRMGTIRSVRTDASDRA